MMAHQVIGHQNISPKIIVSNYLGWNKNNFLSKGGHIINQKFITIQTSGSSLSLRAFD